MSLSIDVAKVYDWKNYCWERVKELNCPWEHVSKKYLISKNDQRKLVAKKQAKRNKKIDDSVEKKIKIQVLDSKGWKDRYREYRFNILNKKRGVNSPFFLPDSVGLSNYFVPTYEINPPTPTRRRVQRNQIRRMCL